MTPAQITEEQRADLARILADDVVVMLASGETLQVALKRAIELVLDRSPISSAEARGYARGLEEAAAWHDEMARECLAKATEDVSADFKRWLVNRANHERFAACCIRALSPSPAQKEEPK